MLEVGGWNVESNFDCAGLTVAREGLKVGEPCAVTATISRTFLDGSRVFLRLDGEVAGAKWAWARGGGKQTLTFPVTFDRPGKHVLALGGQELEVDIQP